MFEINPIGVVNSEIKKPSLKAGSAGLTLEQRLETAREDHPFITASVFLFQPGSSPSAT